MTSFAAILNILPFARDKTWSKTTQNHNDNTSNVAMGNKYIQMPHSQLISLF